MNEKGTVTVPTQGHSDRGIQQAQKRKAFPLALTTSEQIKTGPEFNWVWKNVEAPSKSSKIIET